MRDKVARRAGWIQSKVLVGSLGAADLAEEGVPLRGGFQGAFQVSRMPVWSGFQSVGVSFADPLLLSPTSVVAICPLMA